MGDAGTATPPAPATPPAGVAAIAGLQTGQVQLRELIAALTTLPTTLQSNIAAGRQGGGAASVQPGG
eukprot:1714381-Pyramimonas_sp.AAC.1